MDGNTSTGSSPPPVPSAAARPRIALCRKCGRHIDPAFAYCPYCGNRQKLGLAWYHDPVWVAILALFVLGPFALPLVWYSARMNRAMKFAYTAGILVYTVFTVYYSFQVLSYELGVLSDLTGLL